jgi:hypothetical protein
MRRAFQAIEVLSKHHMNNNNPLWFNKIAHINLLEERKQRLIEERINIDAHIAEIDHSIALLQLSGAPVQPPQPPTTISVGSQTELHLPISKQLMSSPLTRLQEEEEDRKNRIFKSLKKKK